MNLVSFFTIEIAQLFAILISLTSRGTDIISTFPFIMAVIGISLSTFLLLADIIGFADAVAESVDKQNELNRRDLFITSMQSEYNKIALARKTRSIDRRSKIKKIRDEMMDICRSVGGKQSAPANIVFLNQDNALKIMKKSLYYSTMNTGGGLADENRSNAKTGEESKTHGN